MTQAEPRSADFRPATHHIIRIAGFQPASGAMIGPPIVENEEPAGSRRYGYIR